MDLIGLILGLLLLWAFGIACLVALPRRTARADEPGGVSWTIGAGGLAGFFLATLWLRVLSFAGIHFSVIAIALPLLAATLAMGAWAVRRERGTTGDSLRDSLRNSLRNSFSKFRAELSGRSLDRAARVLWRLLLLWPHYSGLLSGKAGNFQHYFPHLKAWPLCCLQSWFYSLLVYESFLRH